MELPSELILLICYNVNLITLKNFACTCNSINNTINNIDWEIYIKSHNSLITNSNIDCNFMKEHGIYLINVMDINIINKWFNYYPRIGIIENILNGNYSQLDYPELMDDYFNGKTYHILSLELSHYEDDLDTLYLFHIYENKMCYYNGNICDIISCIKNIVSKNIISNFELQVGPYSFFH
jgi:hypothetical protein